MDYLGILKRALRITVRQRALWPFGFVPGLLAAGAWLIVTPSQIASYLTPLVAWQQLPGFPTLPLLSELDLAAAQPLLLGAAVLPLLLALPLSVASMLVGSFSAAALIGMVDQVEDAGTTSLERGWRVGKARFLHVLVISLVVTGVLWVASQVLGVLALPLVALPVAGLALGIAWQSLEVIVASVVGTVLGGIGLQVLAFVLGSLVVLLQQLIVRRSVLARESVEQAIRGGYGMARRSWRQAGGLLLVLIGLGLGVRIVTLPIALLGLALVAGVGLAAWSLAHSLVAAILATLPPVLAFAAIAGCLQGLYTVFVSAVWTLTYRQLAAQAEPR